MTLVSSFNKTFETYANKVAIEFNEQKITFREINKNTNQVANALSKVFVNKGDRVAMFLGNSLELIYFFSGILKNGSIFFLHILHFIWVKILFLFINISRIIFPYNKYRPLLILLQ